MIGAIAVDGPAPLNLPGQHVDGHDIAKARALLGWEPRVTLEDGLRETVAYFRGIVATL